MEEYRWGIFLAEQNPDRTVSFGKHKGEPAWQEVPGEHRADLMRLIVVQGDTEPASVEQQRVLGNTAPSIYDLRNLFQVNVEEGRHLWAMVYLLHAYFGREGREEAEQLLKRNSGDLDAPRILGAFNEETTDWLQFFMFTYFTDRDGKYQLGTLKESAFDPLARTCEFMLKEEAHHMFVGTTGVQRIVERTAELMKEHGTDDIWEHGGIPLSVIQKYLNFQFSVSMDLFGSEQSTNAGNYYSSGLKGRWQETRRKDDHVLLEDTREMSYVEDGEIRQKTVPTLSALNLDLRDEYVADCANGVRRWNQALEDAGLEERLILPHEGFNRRVGVYAQHHVSPEGEVLTDEQWADAVDGYLPSAEDRAGGRRPDGAGVRVRQVRRLDRAAADRHQRPAGRVRLRAPRRGGRRVSARRSPGTTRPARPGTPTSSASSARRPAGAFDVSYADGDALPGDWWAARTADGTVVGYGWLDATWGGDAEILLAVDASAQQQGVGTFVLGPARGRGRAPRPQLRLQHGPRRAPAARRRARLARGARLPRLHERHHAAQAGGRRRPAPGAGRRGREGRPRRRPGDLRPRRRGGARPRSRGVRRLRRRRRPPVLTHAGPSREVVRDDPPHPRRAAPREVRLVDRAGGPAPPAGRPGPPPGAGGGTMAGGARPGPGPRVVSPAVRARSTWELVAAELPGTPSAHVVDRVYDASPDELLSVVAELPETARTGLLVGHNPGLEDLVEHLVGEPVRLPTSALALVDVRGPWSGVGRGSGRLRTSGRPPGRV